MAIKPSNSPRKPVSTAPTPDTAPDDGLTDDQRLAVLNGSLIPMTHPDNGTCDRYETNADGAILVPATEADAMFGHGFVVVDVPAVDTPPAE